MWRPASGCRLRLDGAVVVGVCGLVSRADGTVFVKSDYQNVWILLAALMIGLVPAATLVWLGLVDR